MTPTNRVLARFLLIGLPLLALGGCLALAILPDDDDPVDLGSPLPRSEYELSEQICFSVDRLGGGAILTNTGDTGRRFRVVARGEDPSAPERDREIEVRTRWVPADSQALILLPPWPWAVEFDEEAGIDEVLDLQTFTCNWAVFEG